MNVNLKNIKKLDFSRAELIINTSNSKFNKYYEKYPEGILFWISETPYRKYFINLDHWPAEVATQHYSYFIDLLKRNNFKNFKK